MPDIIVIGDINVDLIFNIPAYPTPGTEAIATTIEMHTGGSAVNTAITLARMDMDVGFIGRIGPDPLAQQILGSVGLTPRLSSIIWPDVYSDCGRRKR